MRRLVAAFAMAMGVFGVAAPADAVPTAGVCVASTTGTGTATHLTLDCVGPDDYAGHWDLVLTYENESGLVTGTSPTGDVVVGNYYETCTATTDDTTTRCYNLILYVCAPSCGEAVTVTVCVVGLDRVCPVRPGRTAVGIGVLTGTSPGIPGGPAGALLDDLSEAVDSVVCPVLVSLAPGPSPLVTIDDEGDTSVDGMLLWDCPPYGS